MIKYKLKHLLVFLLVIGVLISSGSTRKYPVTESQKRFIKDAGLGIYAYARKQGYSVFGAELLLALSADKSGYGDEASVDRVFKLNNFWEIKQGNVNHYMQFKTEEEGEQAGIDLITRKYTAFAILLKGNKSNLHKMDSVINKYNGYKSY